MAIAMPTLLVPHAVAAALHRAYSLGWVARRLGRACCRCRCPWRPAPWSRWRGPLVESVHLVALARTDE